MSKSGDTALRAVELAITTGCTASDAWKPAPTLSDIRRQFGTSISETVDAGLIKPVNPDNKSRKLMQYHPFWA
jgi:hypothetical protein